MSTSTDTLTTTTSTSHAGTLRVAVERRAGRSSLVRTDGHVPYAARPVPTCDGWARAVLVQTIAGPLAGDVTAIQIDVGPGAALELATNAATLAYPASVPARHELRVRLGEEARFSWKPEALVLAAGCDLVAQLDLDLGPGAAALTRELVILGRSGEIPGSYKYRLRCELDGRPLLHESVDIDAAGIARNSAAVLRGARAFASLALLGIVPPDAVGAGELDLAGPGRVLRALARSSADLQPLIATREVAWGKELRKRAQRPADRAGSSAETDSP